MTFRDAERAARRSTIRKHKTGAAVYDWRGNLLAVGWSHHSYGLVSTPWSMHAEHHALSRMAKGAEPKTIVIVTLTRNGRLTCSLPCKSCGNLINKYGITEVVAREALEN